MCVLKRERETLRANIDYSPGGSASYIPRASVWDPASHCELLTCRGWSVEGVGSSDRQELVRSVKRALEQRRVDEIWRPRFPRRAARSLE